MLQIQGQALAYSEDLGCPLFLTPVSAGFPSPADDFVECQLDLNRHLIRHPATTFFLRVSGESMTGAGIFPNDLLIVDTSIEPRHNSVVVAVVDGGFTVKRFVQQGITLMLMSENPRYAPILLGGQSEQGIWGVVTHAVHAF